MDHPAPLIVTKVLQPRLRDDWLHRRRLVDFIHARIERKLIIISAPAGYGKTSLLVDFAADSDLPVCWYTVDERDSDPRVFLEYLITSIRRRFPTFGEQIGATLKRSEARLPDWETVAAALVNDMVEAIDEYFVIVLDDFHLISADSTVHELLDTVLRYLPEHCHILLATRSLPPLTLTRLAARQEVDGLGLQELRFTASEIQQLMHQNYELDLPGNQAQELARELDGWIAGLLLTRHTLWKGLFADIIRAQGEAQVFEYLASEVFEQQPENVQSFLLQSAVLDEMSPDLCNSLLERCGCRKLLHFLEAQNLFVARLEGAGEWYRYHLLFRHFLLDRLQRSDAERYYGLHQRAGDLYTARSELAVAIHYYLEARAYEKAADAIEAVAESTFNAGRWQTLANWIDRLPTATLSAHPQLIICRAKVRIQLGETTDAIRELDRAVDVLEEHGSPQDQAEALVVKSAALRMQAQYEPAIAHCQEALHVLEDEASLTAAHAYRSLGICYGNVGRFSDSVAQLLEALELYEAQDRRDNVASVEHDLATTYLRAGDLARASTHYRQALQRWRETQNSARISETLNGMACALYYQGAYAAARELLEEALLEARQAQYARVDAAVLASLGDVAHALGENEQALERYEEALQVAERVAERSIVTHVLNAIGLVYQGLGRQDRARSYIQQALHMAEESGSAYEMGRGHDALGLLFYADSHLDLAVEHFTEARDYFAQCDAKRELAVVNVHLAQALFEATDSAEDPIDYLQRALGLAEELGYDHFLALEGRRSPRLYQQVLPRLDDNGRLQRILEELGAEVPPPVQGVGPEALPARDEPALRIKAFGQAQVWLHGEEITKKQWDSATTKELFFYLLAHPDGVRKDKILEVFWPEATPAKASSAFHSTNYRLRRALNDQTCILYKNGVYMINPELTYWYDVEAFQELIAQAESAGSADERTAIYQEAVVLYKGDYLEEFYSDWHYFQREKLQREYFDALTHLADYYRAHDRPEEALSLYDLIVSADPYQEEIHRDIMRTHVERGERAAAVKRYQELRDFLLEDLDIEPMPETTALYEEILADE